MTTISYRNIDISYRDAKGVQLHVPREDIELIDDIWCVLMYYFDLI